MCYPLVYHIYCSFRMTLLVLKHYFLSVKLLSLVFIIDSTKTWEQFFVFLWQNAQNSAKMQICYCYNYV